MIGRVGIHGANDADLVGVPVCGFLKDFAAPESTVTELIKSKRGREGDAGFAFGGQVSQRQSFAAPFCEFRLGVPCVDLRGSAIEVNVDNVFGPGGLLGAANGQRIGICGGSLEQGGECQHSEAGADGLKPMPACRKLRESEVVHGDPPSCLVEF